MEEAKKESIITSTLEDVLHNSMMPYAEYVILDRALPRVEDGLKPVQRRILYSMYDLGITPDKGYKKSARIVGDCLAKYHPHGDTSVYDAMVRLAQPFNLRMPLVDGHGNFGSVDGDGAAAMRYTEVKLQPLAMELLYEIEKDTVNWSLNFDDSLKEPDTLPGRFPNLLVNGASGIAVGLATNIPPHNLGEVIDGAVAYLDNPKITLDEMLKIIKGPDFPTGGYIIAGDELKTAYTTGKAKIKIRSKVTVEQENGGKKSLVITELPYQVNKAQLLTKIAELQEKNPEILGDISDICDESDRMGMRAVIKLKKDADENKILNFLYNSSNLQVSFGINMVAIASGKPQLLGLLDILKYYTDYQIKVILRRTKFDLDKAKERAHILEGLIIAVTNIDEVIKIIKNAPDTPSAKQSLRERFQLSEKQAQAILDLRLARITKLEVYNLREELETLRKLIAELQSIIDSKKLQKDIVKKEMLIVKKKYKDERRTVIVGNEDDIKTATDELKLENYAIGLNGNYLIRKVKASVYKRCVKNDSPNVNEIFRFVTETDSEKLVYAFTNKGNCYKIDIEQVMEAKGAASGGMKFSQIFKTAESGEQPLVFYSISGVEVPKGKLLFYTKFGTVKLSDWNEYTVLKNCFQALKLKDGDEVLKVEEQIPGSDMFFVTKQGMCLYCAADNIPEQGRISGGVKGIDLGEGDSVIYAGQLNADKDYEAVVAANTGMFKKVIVGTVNKLSRARKGVKIIELGDDGKTFAVFAAAVPEGEKTRLAVKDTSGNMYYTDTEDISVESRTTKGKPILSFGMIQPEEVFPVGK